MSFQVAIQTVPTGLINRLFNGSGVLNPEGTATGADGSTCFLDWTRLAQSNPVETEQLRVPETGQARAIRITQPNATAQRVGLSQRIASINCQDLGDSPVTLSFRGRISANVPIRFAVLGWSGAADTAPADPINDWSSTSYIPGQFFISGVTVRNIGILSMPADEWASAPYIPIQCGHTTNNLYVVIWTQDAIDQDETLDLGSVQLVRGAQTMDYEYRSQQLELALANASERIVLHGDLTLYVNAVTGSDVTGDGSALLPFASRQKAYDTIQDGYDLDGQWTATVRCTGTFTDVFDANGPVVGQWGPEAIKFRGNADNDTDMVVAPTAAGRNGWYGRGDASFTIEYQTFGGTGTSANGILCDDPAYIVVGIGCRAGAANRAKKSAAGGAARIRHTHDLIDEGNANYHDVSENAAYITYDPGVDTQSVSTPAYGDVYALADQKGMITYSGATFSGSGCTAVNGPYRVETGGLIDPGIGGENFLPGGGTGNRLPGGFYISQGIPYLAGFKGPTTQVFYLGSGGYVRPTYCTRIRVRLLGGGGGSAGSGTTPGAGGAGGNTTFGTALLVANGGAAGDQSGNAAIGGTASGGFLNIPGADGGQANGAGGPGAAGGPSYVGGNGAMTGAGAIAAVPGVDGTGGGAGGAATAAGTINSGGGAGGGYCEAWIYAPATTYAYTVGAGGTAGTAGGSGAAGAAGGAGIIIVEEFYD